MNDQPDCARPPAGYYCTKPAGHEGPCPTYPKGGTIEYVRVREATHSHQYADRNIEALHALVSRETVRPQEYAYAYPAEILRWVDGDTVDMRAWKTIDFGFGQKVTPEHTGRFRLTIVDTPERGEPGWAEATDYCKEMLPAGTVVQIRTYRDPDVFGRYLADITIPGMDTTSISSLLLQNGLAKVWE